MKHPLTPAYLGRNPYMRMLRHLAINFYQSSLIQVNSKATLYPSPSQSWQNQQSFFLDSSSSSMNEATTSIGDDINYNDFQRVDFQDKISVTDKADSGSHAPWKSNRKWLGVVFFAWFLIAFGWLLQVVYN